MSSTAHRPAPALVHPGRVVIVAVVAFALSFLVASQDPVPGWELRLTEWLNDAPDILAALLWPIMQLGSVLGPLLAAVCIAVWRRDLLLGIVTAATGLFVWFAAKWVKNLVERGRPLVYLPQIDVREGTGGGLGYVSGHSTVAATTAVFVAAVLPPRWRWLPVLAAGLVGLGRVVYGMHLPADVVGGWAFGTLVGVGGLRMYQRWTTVEPARG